MCLRNSNHCFSWDTNEFVCWDIETKGSSLKIEDRIVELLLP